MTTEFKSSSGATIVINAAPWQDAKQLKKAVEKELSTIQGLSDIKLSFESVDALATVLKLDSSDDIDAALWPCLARCTRNKEKITEKTFDDVEARKDYYEIVTACMKENLAPLFEGLFSRLSEFGIIQKQEQPQKSA